MLIQKQMDRIKVLFRCSPRIVTELKPWRRHNSWHIAGKRSKHRKLVESPLLRLLVKVIDTGENKTRTNLVWQISLSNYCNFLLLACYPLYARNNKWNSRRFSIQSGCIDQVCSVAVPLTERYSRIIPLSFPVHIGDQPNPSPSLPLPSPWVHCLKRHKWAL